MNQNGMQVAAGASQICGDQPADPQMSLRQIMSFLNDENNWKEENYRNRVRCLTVTEHQNIFDNIYSNFPTQ